MSDQNKILHLTPHTGGGVGTVLLNWVSKDYTNKHTIYSLGFMESRHKESCDKYNIQYKDNIDHSIVLKGIENTDILIIHFWNHPLLYDFLLNNEMPKCRIITWCHNSGFYLPYIIPDKIVDISDKFIFTSPISYDLDIVHNFDKDKFDCIWSTGGIDKYKNLKFKEHKTLNILYAGAVDFSKLTDEFVFICSQISKKITNVRFIVCGTGSSEQKIIEQVKELHLEDKFIFTGWVEDLTPYIEQSDIFLYLLDSKSFSTCEQVLGEVMSCGLVPIVYNNPAESVIVSNLKNGIIISNIEECINAVYTLYEDKIIYQFFSENAKETAKDLYCIDKMIDKWNSVFKNIMNQDKTIKIWDKEHLDYSKGFNLFTESLGNENKLFRDYVLIKKQLTELLKSNNQWKSNTKGSINHYLEYFKDDEDLKELSKLINKEN